MTMTDKPAQPETVEAQPSASRRIAPQVVAGVVLILIGTLWLLQRLGVVDLTVTTVLAIATIVTGLALMVLASDGPHTGLIVFGTILALVATLTAAAPLQGFQGGVGERVVEINDIGDLESDYNLAMGELTIDLSSVDSLDSIESFSASVGLGELRIRLPEGVPVSVSASAGAGELQVFDRNANGLGVDQSFESAGFDDEGAAFIIDANVFMGRVEVSNG